MLPPARTRPILKAFAEVMHPRGYHGRWSESGRLMPTHAPDPTWKTHLDQAHAHIVAADREHQSVRHALAAGHSINAKTHQSLALRHANLAGAHLGAALSGIPGNHPAVPALNSAKAAMRNMNIGQADIHIEQAAGIVANNTMMSDAALPRRRA